MKLQRFHSSVRTAFAVACLAFVLTSIPSMAEPPPAASSAHSEKIARNASSWLQEDQDGVLWFCKGEDGETEYSASLVLSGVKDTVVITVTANAKHLKDAVGLAKKMRTVLQNDQRTPDKVFIVAWEDDAPGVGYRFYTDGLGVTHEDYDNDGVFTPAQAKSKTILRRVAKHYRILRDEFVAAGKWGKDHEDWRALTIVKLTENKEH